MRRKRRVPSFEVIHGLNAVWVNDATGCLGRFGVRGIDVHSTIDAQLMGAAQCLYCTHANVTVADWTRFQQAMLEFHDVDLSDQPLPSWLC